MIDILHEHATLILTAAYLLLELLAVIAAVHAIMHVRTAQGATAWMLALITLPFISLPLYAVFGRRRFVGYVAARRAGDAAIADETIGLTNTLGSQFRADLDRDSRRYRGFETIAGRPFLSANETTLLINGEATFAAIFKALAEAREYALVEFYIIRDDELGRQLRTVLIDCLERGVRVYLQYDSLGSYKLSESFSAPLRAAGAQVRAFASSSGPTRRLQINFRNHRKLVVVDGQVAFVGGHNVGDEYVGRDPRLSPWRDTHVQIRGPAAAAAQVPFLEDWYWSSGELPSVSWEPAPAAAGHAVLSLPSSPSDEREPGALLFVHAIHSARTRLWIVSPYFVPNGSIIDGLKLAALRGVDVRILIPGLNDNRLAALAGHAYLAELIGSGVRFFKYSNGCLHQKVMLIDDDLATVGTANLDQRSMWLNFEHTMVIADRGVADDVEAMLLDDFACSEELIKEEVAGDPWWLQAAARGARLLAPVL